MLVEIRGEKLVRGPFYLPPILNNVKINLSAKTNLGELYCKNHTSEKKVKQEMLRVVAIAVVSFTLIHFENFNILGGLYNPVKNL